MRAWGGRGAPLTRCWHSSPAFQQPWSNLGIKSAGKEGRKTTGLSHSLEGMCIWTNSSQTPFPLPLCGVSEVAYRNGHIPFPQDRASPAGHTQPEARAASTADFGRFPSEGRKASPEGKALLVSRSESEGK